MSEQPKQVNPYDISVPLADALEIHRQASEAHALIPLRALQLQVQTVNYSPKFKVALIGELLNLVNMIDQEEKS